MNNLLKSVSTGFMSVIVRSAIMLIAFTAIFAIWIGSAPSPSRGAGNAPAVPDVEGQRKYLELARAEHDALLAWQPLTTFTFDNPADLKFLHVCDGEWKISNGQLQAVSGKPDNYRTILLAPCPAGPMRIEFDATLFPRPDCRIGDIYIRLNADPATGDATRGYGLFVARYFNQDSVCYKLNQPIARTEWSPIVPGQRHHIIAEWTTVHLRLYVDGRVILDAWDREKPIAPDPTKWIGLAVYDTLLSVDNFTISTPKKKAE